MIRPAPFVSVAGGRMPAAHAAPSGRAAVGGGSVVSPPRWPRIPKEIQEHLTQAELEALSRLMAAFPRSRLGKFVPAHKEGDRGS